MFPTNEERKSETRRRELASALTQIRLSRKMTISRAAELLGWSRTTLVAIEHARQATTVDQLYQLADLYRVDVTAFFPLNLNAWLQQIGPSQLTAGLRERIAARPNKR